MSDKDLNKCCGGNCGCGSEKEEKHEGVAGSDCYCRPYSGGGVWLQD